MCFEGNCCCLKLETGTLIFGVIYSVLHSVLVLVAIGLMIKLNVEVTHEINQYTSIEISNDGSISFYGFDNRPMMFVNIVLFVALFFCVLSLTFGVLLCSGVTKRKPSYIRAFFIYGEVTGVICSIGSIVMIRGGHIVFGSLISVAMIVYFFILHMVKLTYVKIRVSTSVHPDHERLIE